MSFPKFIKILGFELQAEGNIQKCHTCDHLYLFSQPVKNQAFDRKYYN